MPVRFENYSHSFELNGKPVFAPSELGRRIGDDVKERVERAFLFDDFYYHLRRGGHIAALHSHRNYRFFCKLDIENFFYSVARNRVVRSLRSVGIARADHYGKWSCVKNPYGTPSYALPYGFVQSPILATLVLAQSPIGHRLRSLHPNTNVAVYVDDISLSSNDLAALHVAYTQLQDAFDQAGFVPNPAKSVPPCVRMSVFNCSVTKDETLVLPERRQEFASVPRSAASVTSFENYCAAVSNGNAGIG